MTMPAGDEPVLSTLNKDGSRRKIRPVLSHGRFLRWRRVVAYLLFAIFTITPYIKVGGRPLILLDLPKREFTIFSVVFYPTDTILLMLLLVSVILTIFLLTALFGRVWCGWACPQTVYMEFIFRPIERLFEGSPAKQRKIDAQGMNGRRLLKNVVFFLVAMFVAHTFLAYFVGVDRLLVWVRRSPFQHPAAFLVMAVVTVAMFIDFAWFREQTCIVACPYGRIQSVLLDRQSLIIGYDPRRGEPRGRRKKGADDAKLGDCIDCGACVRTCPTGIDIRKGLQMECIGCAQCIDACDAIMDKVHKPRGLIRYSTEDGLAGKAYRLLRPRVIIYPAIIAIAVGALAYLLSTRASAEVMVVRAIEAPYTLVEGGRVVNRLRVKVRNRTGAPHKYTVDLPGEPELKLIAPENPFTVGPGKRRVDVVFVEAPAAVFAGSGVKRVKVRVRDDAGFVKLVTYPLLGPARAPGSKEAKP